MCVISVDRYISIRKPLETRNKSRTTVGIRIAVVWIISLAIASPILFLGIFHPGDILSEDYECGIFNRYFVIYGSLAAFFVPLLLMLVAYSLTIDLLNKQARRCARRNQDGGLRRSTTRKKIRIKDTRNPEENQTSFSSRGSVVSSPRVSVDYSSRGSSRASGSMFHSMNGVSRKVRISDRQNADPSEIEPLHQPQQPGDASPDEQDSPTRPVRSLPVGNIDQHCGQKHLAVPGERPGGRGRRRTVGDCRQLASSSPPSPTPPRTVHDLSGAGRDLADAPQQIIITDTSCFPSQRNGDDDDEEVYTQADTDDSQSPPKFRHLVKKHSAAFRMAGILMAKRDDHKKELNTVHTERKAVKVLGTMFALFVICWAPFFTVNLMLGICPTSCSADMLAFKVFLWLGYVSSTLNPIIYTIFNKTFKTTFVDILACRYPRRAARDRQPSRPYILSPSMRFRGSNCTEVINLNETNI